MTLFEEWHIWLDLVFFSSQDLRNKIEELKEKELSLDDMDDECSSYIMEEKYQQKFVKVWNKLCELKQKSASTGRPSEKRFRYSGMSFKGRSHCGRMVVFTTNYAIGAYQH